MESQKQQNYLCSFPRQTTQYHSFQAYALTSNAYEAEVEWFYEDLQDFRELTPQNDVFFIIGDWNAKVGSQEIPRPTGKFGLRVQSEAGQRLNRVLPRKHTRHSKHPLPTTQDITRWSIPKSDRLHSLQPTMKQSAKTIPGADCGSDHELLIAKFRLKLKKIGKITRPFRYDLI